MYYFKIDELVYIKKKSDAECEYIKLEVKSERCIITYVNTIKSNPDNMNIFLEGAIRIPGEQYNALLYALKKTT